MFRNHFRRAQDFHPKRNSIGLVLVGGMFVGTLFTLFVIPSIYMLIARDHEMDRERGEASATAEG